MDATIYNAQGKKSGTISLPENLFGLPWNASLMHQVVTSMQDNARTNVAHVKDRSEVRGGGKKPWQQKGTGRARHGSIRSPIWKGGGVTHGPRAEKDYSREIPKKMRAKALFVALSRKMKDGEIIFIDSFGIGEPKTALAKKVLDTLAKSIGKENLMKKNSNAALVAFADPTEQAVKSFRNLGNVSTISVRNLNPHVILKNSYLVIENPEAALAIVSTRMKSRTETPIQAKTPATPRKRATTKASAEKPVRASKAAKK